MQPIKVVVHGASGRVGQEVVRAVCREADMELVGAVDLKAASDSLNLPEGPGTVPFSTDVKTILTSCRPDVMVDFSIVQATMPAARLALRNGVCMVIGTTGLSPENIKEIEQLATQNNVGAVVASNFALGAVLMIHLAKIAAKYLDYAEIIELHHHLKVDAPSGTAKTTAQAMAAARGKPFLQPPGKPAPSRGEQVEGVTIHSVRLPGLMAHQEVILGAPGQTVSIRHDTINRECYMPGVLLAIREVIKRKGLVSGLDTLLGL
jgi:4-hydroxy-tetrahydrodipicolinate reductase